MEIKIPNGNLMRKFGKINGDGNGNKTFRPNWKAVTAIIALLGFGGTVIYGATVWIVQVTDTTKTVKILKQNFEHRKDTIDSAMDEIVIIQETSRTLLRGLIRELLPAQKADTIIKSSEEQETKLVERLNKKKSEKQ